MQSSWAGSTKEDVPRGFFLRRVLHLKREIRVNRDAVLSVPDGVTDRRNRTLSMSVMGILQQLPSPESLVDFCICYLWI